MCPKSGRSIESAHPAVRGIIFKFSYFVNANNTFAFRVYSDSLSMKQIVCLLSGNENRFRNERPDGTILDRVEHDGIVWLNCRCYESGLRVIRAVYNRISLSPLTQE